MQKIFDDIDGNTVVVFGDGADPSLLFTDDNWYKFHDTVYEVTGISNTKVQLMIIFDQLPINIQNIAFEWGLTDTVFNDKAYTFIKEKINE